MTIFSFSGDLNNDQLYDGRPSVYFMTSNSFSHGRREINGDAMEGPLFLALNE